MDKIAGLKEILALDPKNSFARYGMAMELASRGEIDAALKEFDILLAHDPDYTAATLCRRRLWPRQGAIQKPSIGSRPASAARRAAGNNHALSEMQGMLDELDR